MAGASFKLIVPNGRRVLQAHRCRGGRSFRNVWMLRSSRCVRLCASYTTFRRGQCRKPIRQDTVAGTRRERLCLYESVAINTYLGDVLREQLAALPRSCSSAGHTDPRALRPGECACCRKWMRKVGSFKHASPPAALRCNPRGQARASAPRGEGAGGRAAGTRGHGWIHPGAQFSADARHCLNLAEVIGSSGKRAQTATIAHGVAIYCAVLAALPHTTSVLACNCRKEEAETETGD